MARGASAAKAVMVLSSRSSYPLEQVAEHATTPLWYQLHLEGDASDNRARVDRAVSLGCKVICVTAGARQTQPRCGRASIGPRSIDSARRPAPQWF